MRFLMIYKPADIERAESDAPPCPDEMGKMGAFITELTQAGVLLATEGCKPTAKGARVRLTRGNVTVTDGPFTEAKELIAGFALVQTKSKAEAIHLAERFLKLAGDGESEIRQVFDPSDPV
jgi:hypothetical protein